MGREVGTVACMRLREQWPLSPPGGGDSSLHEVERTVAPVTQPGGGESSLHEVREPWPLCLSLN